MLQNLHYCIHWSFQTSFHFDVEQKYFHQALDIFAQFFIHPLLRQDSVDREIQAVDSGKLSSTCSVMDCEPDKQMTESWYEAICLQYYTRFIQFCGDTGWVKMLNLLLHVQLVWWSVWFFAIKNVEYQMSLPSDDERACMLYGSLAKEGHPMGKFFTGNLMSVWPNTIDVCIVSDLWNILNILSTAYGNL